MNRVAHVMCWIAVSAVAASSRGEAVAEKLELQPTSERSWLNSASDNIRDSDLAAWVEELIRDDDTGELRYHDATFLFNQCFGGGFVDNMSQVFGRGQPYVVGSASLHGQRAVGTLTPAEAAAREPALRPPEEFIQDTPGSTWTQALVPALKTSASVLDAINTAETTDRVGPNAAAPYTQLEQPQWSSRAIDDETGSHDIKLTDPEATTRYAVIWGGARGSKRHFENMKAMRELLIEKWSLADDTTAIVMFYGDGVHAPGGGEFPEEWHVRPGTKDRLRTHIRDTLPFSMTPDTQFLFYATGHGGTSKKLPKPERLLRTGITDADSFDLSVSELAMLAEEDASATMVINYSILAAASASLQPGLVTVTLNGDVLGSFSPDGNVFELEFPIPMGGLLASNTFEIANDSGYDLYLSSSEYLIGNLLDQPPTVPEPAASAMLAILLPWMMRRARRLCLAEGASRSRVVDKK